MEFRTDSASYTDQQGRNPSPYQASSWTARLEKLSPLERLYVLNHLPLHLDVAADSQSVQRLIQLAEDDFPRIKAEQTLDPALSSLDYRYYFRATLRAENPAAALRLARSRRRLSRMTDWLASGDLGGLLPNLSSDSSLWEQIRRSFESLQQPSVRVENLRKLHRPGLAPAMYAWMRDVFDQDGSATNETAQRRFLAAVASHERGAMAYVLSRAARPKADEELIRAILTNLESLCAGSGIAVPEALKQVAALTIERAEAFLAAADTLAEMEDRTTAVTALTAFESVLPKADDSPFPLLCSTALAHALAAQGERKRAEAMAARSLELIPPVLGDTALNILYAASYVDAGGRLAQACAPFPLLWIRATADAEQLTARATGLSHRSQALAHFVRVTPWIAEPRDRLRWLAKWLREIEEFSSQDLIKESDDPVDSAHRLFRSEMRGESWRKQLTEPILDAMIETLAKIDRILVSPGELGPLMDLIAAAARLFGLMEDEEREGYPLLVKLVSAMSRSGNMNVHVVGIESLLQLISGGASEEDASVLARALSGLLRGRDQEAVLGLVPGLLDHIDEACGRNVQARVAIADSFLTAAVESQQVVVLDIVRSKAADWLDDLDSEMTTWLIARIAATMMRFGRSEEAQELIAELDESDLDTRVMMARLLLEMDSAAEAATLLMHDLSDSVDLGAENGLESVLEIASLTVRASGSDAARSLLLSAADQYRDMVGQVSDEVEAALLNGVLGLKDRQTIHLLISRAEKELLLSDEGDAQMAALWYLALALSASGDMEATKKVWRQISGWREQRRVGSVCGEMVRILERTAFADGPAEAIELKEIDAILSAVEKRDARERILLQLCRALKIASPAIANGIATLILKWAVELPAGQQNSVLTALCGTLAELPSTNVSGGIVEGVLNMIGRRKPPQRSGDPELVLRSVLRLIESDAEHNRAAIGKLLEQLVHAYAGSFESEVFEEALCLEPDLARVLSLCGRVRKKRDRSLFLVALAKAAARSGDRVTLDSILLELSSWTDQEARLESLGALYDCCRSAASSAVVEAIEAQIRSAPPPTDAASILRWTSHLAGTPLEDLFDAALVQLSENPNPFAATPRDLDAIQAFLSLKPRPGLPQQTDRFKKMIGWAAHMPPVTNEDWRHRAFVLILNASADLPPQERDAIQRLALRTAVEALADRKFEFDQFGRSLAGLPWTRTTAGWALSTWLDAKGTGKGSRTDQCVDVIVAGLEYSAADAEPSVMDGFVRLLETMTERPSHFKRTAAARVAVECRHTAFEAHLSDLLLHEYEAKGLLGLEEWDLAFLARMPLMWWVERSPQIELRARRRELVSWVERVAHHSPDASWWALTLGCEWLSQSDPGDMENFWFDLYTLSPELPPATREVLAHSLRAASLPSLK